MAVLEELIKNPKSKGMTLSAPSGQSYKVALVDNFEYKDPIDGSISKNQVRALLCV